MYCKVLTESINCRAFFKKILLGGQYLKRAGQSSEGAGQKLRRGKSKFRRGTIFFVGGAYFSHFFVTGQLFHERRQFLDEKPLNSLTEKVVVLFFFFSLFHKNFFSPYIFLHFLLRLHIYHYQPET